MASKSKKLRSGYTTGACAAAAAKAATSILLGSIEWKMENGRWKIRQGTTKPLPSSLFPLPLYSIEIPFPDGSRHTFSIQQSAVSIQHEGTIATASVIKDAGDDPDVTNGAEIAAEARIMEDGKWKMENWIADSGDSSICHLPCSIILKGGRGVGTVTKPGLAVQVGEPAINPVPRKMICKAVAEAIEERWKMENGKWKTDPEDHQNLPSSIFHLPLEVTISVPDGEELAKKTLNARLGIIGGISILGTSGIVRPLSAEAWTASITASMDVASATGCSEIVLSAGRVSEKAHMKKYGLPDESYVMMGDYVEFSLVDAKKHNFNKIHISAHWAKMLKIAMGIPQTHVRHGAIDLGQAALFLNNLIPGLLDQAYEFNTAREIYDVINSKPGALNLEIFIMVCAWAKAYAEGIASGLPVTAHLVSYEGEIIAESE